MKTQTGQTLDRQPTPVGVGSGGGFCSEPLRRAYSHDEALAVANEWMRENYGRPRDLSEEYRDRYHEKLGLLIDFLWSLHPPESSPNGADQPRAAEKL